MPFFDKHWWLWMLSAIVAVVLAVAVPLDSLSWQVSLTRNYGDNPALDVIAIGGYVLILLTAGGLFVKLGLDAHARLRLRGAAISGDGAPIPLAAPLQLYPEEHIDRDVTELTLSWPGTSTQRRLWARVRIALGIGILVLLGGGTLILIAHPPLYHYVVIDIIGIVPGWFAGIYLLRRWVESAYRTSARMAADSTGIRWLPVLGVRRELRWDEARLLEVARTVGGPRQFTLYAERATIWWMDDYSVRPASMPHYTILDMIEARSGLVPRTFDKRLTVTRQPESAR